MQPTPDKANEGVGSEDHWDHSGQEEDEDDVGILPQLELEPGSGSEDHCGGSSIDDSIGIDSEDYSSETTSFVEAGQGSAMLEVDTDLDGTASVYAMSTYPRVLLEYREERPYEDSEETDPELDGEETIDSARTLYAEDFDFVFENGRRYCGDYYMPCDDDEQTRQWLIHQVYRDLFHNELTTVPLEDPTHVLDIGTGIGEWATDFAEKYPECQVWGTDIAPVQPDQVPVNVEWNLEDAEQDWARPPDTFDLVHLRNLAGAFSDWDFIYRQAFHCLKPGAWIEILDFDDARAFKNFTSFYPPGSPVHILTNSLHQASIVAGRRNGVAHLDPKHLIDAGFVDVKTSTHDLPMGHRENRAFGNKWLLACCLGVEAIFMRALTRHLGMDGDYVRQLCKALQDETRALADDPTRARGFVIKLRVVVARKPVVPGQWNAQALVENGEIADFSGDESTIGSLSQTRRSEDTT